MPPLSFWIERHETRSLGICRWICLQQLDKMGESLNKSCPTYVTSQFISKLQPLIARPLVLQAHNVAQLEKAIEAARRIEHSFITSANVESPTPSQQDSPSTSTVSHQWDFTAYCISQHFWSILRQSAFSGTTILLDLRSHTTLGSCLSSTVTQKEQEALKS